MKATKEQKEKIIKVKEKLIESNKDLIESLVISYKTARQTGDIWGAKSFDKSIYMLEKENKKLLKQIEKGK